MNRAFLAATPLPILVAGLLLSSAVLSQDKPDQNLVKPSVSSVTAKPSRLGFVHTEIREFTLEEAVRMSPTVVLATVGSYTTSLLPNGLPARHYELFVQANLLGEAPGNLIVSIAGGRIGDLEVRVSDAPKLTTGQRAVFFLKQDEVDGRFGLLGLSRGLLNVQSDSLDEIGTVQGALSLHNERTEMFAQRLLETSARVQAAASEQKESAR